MGATFLTVDLGNSAIKLRAWSLDSAEVLACCARLDVASNTQNSTALAQFFAGNPALELAAMSSVANLETTAIWSERIGTSTHAKLFQDLAAGLSNRTREPERVGPDRLFAARGALEWIGESAVVVEVGTALKVDALLAEPASAVAAGWRRGAFLGGAIAPGPRLLARALAQGAARLYEVEPQPDPPALGRDTSEALRAGIGVGLRGAARELALEVARAAGLENPPIVLSGGARAFVASAFSERRVFESEHLVHFGLCAALLEADGRARPAIFIAR